MSDYTTLIGAEQVGNAGYAMERAAERMTNAANQIEDTLQRFGQRMEEWVSRLETIAAEEGRP